MNNLAKAFPLASILTFSTSSFAAPAISNVSVTQDTATKTVTVAYDLNEEAIVTIDVLTNGVSIGAGNVRFLAGDVQRRVAGGTGHKILWAADKSWPGHDASGVSVELTGWTLSAPPPYLVVDLAKSGEWTYYVSEESLPDGIGSPLYRTGKIVMRKIPAQGVSWRMGEPTGSGYETAHAVTFSKDYYLSVFEVTQGQLQFVASTAKSAFTQDDDADLLPVDNVNYGMCRGGSLDPETSGKTATGTGSRWPDDGHADVAASSYIGLFRARTGLSLDLPTSAQWEYACRAGCGESRYMPVDLDDLAWYSENSQEGGSSNRTHAVGTRKANSWGLYDMYGNVREWVLDRKTTGGYPSTAVTDPEGPTIADQGCNDPVRLLRGGTYESPASCCRSAFVCEENGFSGNRWATGFRLACPVD